MATDHPFGCSFARLGGGNGGALAPPLSLVQPDRLPMLSSSYSLQP
jgi:hypothetical protein